jgi:hypothetical protein
MTVEEDRKRILEIQKELMSEVMDYQIRNGSESVVWHVSIQFAGHREG